MRYGRYMFCISFKGKTVWPGPRWATNSGSKEEKEKAVRLEWLEIGGGAINQARLRADLHETTISAFSYFYLFQDRIVTVYKQVLKLCLLLLHINILYSSIQVINLSQDKVAFQDAVLKIQVKIWSRNGSSWDIHFLAAIGPMVPMETEHSSGGKCWQKAFTYLGVFQVFEVCT